MVGHAESCLRRTTRVLSCSGPVPWDLKYPDYERFAEIPALHYAVFRGLLDSYLSIYGSLENNPALALLRRLDLTPGSVTREPPSLPTKFSRNTPVVLTPSEHETAGKLKSALTAGHTNHYNSPDAW